MALGLAGCGDDADRSPVLVMAASSLTDVFAVMETEFEAANPDLDVQLNLAGSGSLREQILQGAPGDVFASANSATMTAVIQAGAAADSTVFATNELTIAVPAGNPAGIEGVQDLADPDLLIGLCISSVPCGDFARRALELAGVNASVDTNEGDVRALLTKIEAGELDAGIVYVTDIASAPVESVPLPGDIDLDIAYPIAPLGDAPNPDGARRFTEFVLSSAGRRILDDHGFGRP